MLESVPYTMSMLFTMTLICYSLMVIYTSYQKGKTAINWLFILLSLVMSIWSMSFAVASGTADIAAAELWHRIASIGYGTAYSFLLHFTLLLTGHKKLLRRWYIYILLYVPAVFNIVLFALPQQWMPYDYVLQSIDGGWIVLSNNSWQDSYFYAYYLINLIITFIVLCKWRLQSSDARLIKQFRLVFYPLLVAAVFGSLTDMIFSDFFNIQIPQVAPILVLLPLFGGFYASEQYDMMCSEEDSIEDEVLRSEIKDLLYRYMAIGFILGGILAFVMEYVLGGDPLMPSLIFGGVISFFGMVIGAVFAKVNRESTKDNVVLIVVALLIPLILFSDIQTASSNVWVTPFLLLIPFMLYNNSKMFTGLSAASVLTLIIIGLIQPSVTVVVDRFDYGLRILLMSLGIVLAGIINQIYLDKLRINARQAANQKMVAEVSSLMAGAVQDNFDERLEDILSAIGRHFDMDRCYYFTVDAIAGTMSYTHDWCRDGVESGVGALTDIPLSMFPWWKARISENKVVIVEDVSRMPEVAAAEMEKFKHHGIHATIAVAVMEGDSLIGYIGLDSLGKKIHWTEELLTFLKIIGNVVSEAFAKNRAEKVIHDLAYYDQLTGLPSRQLFADRLVQAMRQTARTGEKTLVALLDLDAFKSINDTLGHDKGDMLLKDVAYRLSRALRVSDTVCRFGGDEFLIMCSGLKQDSDALAVGEEVMDVFRKSFVLEHDEFSVTASMGIAIYPDDGESTEKLIKNADIAMYHAKAMGKNTFAMCNENLKERTHYLAMLTNSLYKAIDKEELFMVYQPQVAVDSGEVTGVEALIRWRHSKIGLISPVEFIPIAERNGYILELGDWVFREVFRQIRIWEKEGHDDFTVAVNVSFIQIRNPLFVHQLEELVGECGIDPGRLELEITEGIAMTDKTDIADRLQRLRDLGITIAIDDFGTDYSSLGRLKELTVDKIKIAKPFVNGIHQQHKDEAIIKSIIALARNLDVTTIAEGVEEAEQVGFLDEQSCDYIQGYYYYKPMMPEEISALMVKQKSMRLSYDA